MQTNVSNTTSFDVINAALGDFRKDYRLHYIAAYTSRLDGLKQKLADNGGDIEKVYPYPSSCIARREYVQARKRYEWSRNVTERLPLGQDPSDKEYAPGKFMRTGCRRPGDPYYVRMKQEAYESAKAEAIKAADCSIDGYIHKLVGKIGDDIQFAVYAGDLWFGSTLTARLGSGEHQHWKTKCILNVSCLGTVFNQWPTRKIKE